MKHLVRLTFTVEYVYEYEVESDSAENAVCVIQDNHLPSLSGPVDYSYRPNSAPVLGIDQAENVWSGMREWKVDYVRELNSLGD